MFLRNEVNDISQIHIGNQWLHVLPRMTRARLRSISREITKCQPIQNLEEMKDYWKSIYGYELPKDSSQIFCNVTFYYDL